MNESTDIQTRLDSLSHVGQTALALLCADRDSAEMRFSAECLSAPLSTAHKTPLTPKQRKLGATYLRKLRRAEVFQAQCREQGMFSGSMDFAPLGNVRLHNAFIAEVRGYTWDGFAAMNLDLFLARTPGLGKKGVALLRHTLLELARAAELDGIPVSDAGTRLLGALNRPAPEPKQPRYRICEACGARHKIS